jgi:amino acid transporter
MSTTSLYFLTMLDNINDLFLITTIIFSIGLFFTILFFIVAISDKEEENANLCKKLFKIFTPIAFISLLFLTFIPTTKQVVFIYMAEKISNNEDAKQIPQNTIKFLNLKLQEYIKDQEIKINKKGE